MPTYEYACKDCGNHFDIVQSFSDDALTVCPSCEGRLRKVFSAAGIIFKGSGWHIKDYADSSSPAANSRGGAASGDTGGSSDSKKSAATTSSSRSGAAASPGSSSSSGSRSSSSSSSSSSDTAKSA